MTDTTSTEEETNNQHGVSPVFETSLTWLPDEVTAYAFDQFEDRLAEFLRGDYESPVLYPDETAVFDYSHQTVTVTETVVTALLADAIAEKLRDMKREIKTGERDDFTVAEIEGFRRETTSKL